MPEKDLNKDLKIAIFLPFLKGDAKGGAEKLFLELKEHFKADCYIGGLDLDGWQKELSQEDSFVDKLWNTAGKVEFFHTESKIPVWRLIKRQLFFLFSPKAKQLNDYDVVLFSFGNVFFVPNRLSKKVVKIGYCHTPPRPFTDQIQATKAKLPKIFSPLVSVFAKFILFFWARAFNQVDLKICNSQNIKNRVYKYTKLKTDQVIFPFADTEKFRFIDSKDYFLSYARLEEAKRIPLILEAFSQMPDQKLVICSSGPLADWVKTQIQTRKLTNIDFRGRVSDAELAQLVGNCRAGVFIPKDEDAGMTQIELMSAGKPVIGVTEGGLLETIIDKQTGVLLPKNIQLEDLKKAVKEMTKEKALAMKEKSQEQGKKFNKQGFLKQIEKVIIENIS